MSIQSTVSHGCNEYKSMLRAWGCNSGYYGSVTVCHWLCMTCMKIMNMYVHLCFSFLCTYRIPHPDFSGCMVQYCLVLLLLFLLCYHVVNYNDCLYYKQDTVEEQPTCLRSELLSQLLDLTRCI